VPRSVSPFVVLSLLVVGLSGAWRALPADAAATADLTLQVTAGFDGYGRIGHSLPILAAVTNSGADVTATLVAIDPQDPAGPAAPGPPELFRTRYSLTVTLPHGSHKVFQLDVPLRSLAREVSLDLVAPGHAVVGVRAPITVLGNRQLLVGFVSDTRAMLPSLQQSSLPHANSGGAETPDVAAMTPFELPVQPSELASFDALVLDNATTSVLSAEQRTALDGWVQQGGVLLLAGGAGWERVAAGLPQDLIPIRSPRLQTVNDLQMMGTFVESAPPVRQPALLTAATAAEGTVLVGQPGVPLLVLAQRGSGAVVFSALDFCAEPLLHWAATPELWRRLLVLALPAATLLAPSSPLQMANDPYGNMGGPLSTISADLPPSLRILAVLLALYVVLAAPVNYLLLRRMRRRGLSWLTLPALAAGFAILTYGVAFRTKGSPTVVNTITVTEFPPGAHVGKLLTFVGLFAPPEQYYHLQLGQPGPITSLPVTAYKRYAPPIAGVPTPEPSVGLDVHSASARVDLLPVPRWGMRAIRSDAWTIGAAGIDASLGVDGTGISGTIVNHTSQALEDCVVSGPWGAQRLGTLAPGRSAHVDLRRAPTAPAAPLGQVYGYSPAQNDLPPAVLRQMRLRQQVVSAFWTFFGPYSSVAPELGPVFLLGWTPPAGSPPLVDGAPVPQAGIGLLAAGLPVDVDHTAVVPPGLIPVHLWSVNGNAPTQGANVALGNGDLTVVGRLPIPPASVRSVTFSVTIPGSQSSSSMSISAYDRATGAYDAVTQVAVTQVQTQAAPFPSFSSQGFAVAVASKAVANPTAGATPTHGTPTPRPQLLTIPAPAVAQAPKFVATELDATIGTNQLSRFLGADGTMLFRLEHSGTGIVTLGPMTIGFTRSEPGR